MDPDIVDKIPSAPAAPNVPPPAIPPVPIITEIVLPEIVLLFQPPPTVIL
jgi:hypothetical protein